MAQPCAPSGICRRTSWICLLVAVFGLGTARAETGSRTDPPSACPPGHTLVVAASPLTREQAQLLGRADSLLIMIPGITSGDLDENCRFLERVRAQGAQAVALFYDWEAHNLARKVAAPAAVDPAAEKLLALCAAFQAGAGGWKSIDILAHSAGTVVVNKAAHTAARTGSPVRFRHVLLLGTALAADEPLDELKAMSASVLNLHSAHDKVNRNINDQLGRLSALEGGAYRNFRMDHSLGGRLIRHYVFLSSDPENWRQYGTYLAGGEWPPPDPALPGADAAPARLHGLAQWVQAHPDEPRPDIRAALPEWLGQADPEARYYAVILAGLLREQALGPALTNLLAADPAPVYLRKEIYQALGNLRNGVYIDLLKSSRRSDRACAGEIRDVLRSLKRQRIEPVRP